MNAMEPGSASALVIPCPSAECSLKSWKVAVSAMPFPATVPVSLKMTLAWAVDVAYRQTPR